SRGEGEGDRPRQGRGALEGAVRRAGGEELRRERPAARRAEGDGRRGEGHAGGADLEGPVEAQKTRLVIDGGHDFARDARSPHRGSGAEPVDHGRLAEGAHALSL